VSLYIQEEPQYTSYNHDVSMLRIHVYTL